MGPLPDPPSTPVSLDTPGESEPNQTGLGVAEWSEERHNLSLGIRAAWVETRAVEVSGVGPLLEQVRPVSVGRPRVEGGGRSETVEVRQTRPGGLLQTVGVDESPPGRVPGHKVSVADGDRSDVVRTTEDTTQGFRSSVPGPCVPEGLRIWDGFERPF